MTSIAAFVDTEQNKIYIASDHQLSKGSMAIDHKFNKLLEVEKNGTCFIGTAGYAADINITREYAMLWTDMIAEEDKELLMDFDTHMEYLKSKMCFTEFIINFLGEFLAFKKARWELIDPESSAGSDHILAGPNGLFLLSADGFTHPVIDHCAIGSGEDEIRNFMDLKQDEYEGDIANLLIDAIQHASKRDGGTNDKVVVQCVEIRDSSINYVAGFSRISPHKDADAFYKEKKEKELAELEEAKGSDGSANSDEMLIGKLTVKELSDMGIEVVDEPEDKSKDTEETKK